MARVLIEAGADLEATAAADAGGVPGGTALVHAAVFGMTEVLDVLVAAGTPVDAVDPIWGGQALRTAAANGRTASVRHLLALGADPSLLDADPPGPDGAGGRPG